MKNFLKFLIFFVVSSPNFAFSQLVPENYSDIQICRYAIHPNSRSWGQGNGYDSYVLEANKRSLTLNDCLQIIKLNKSSNNTSKSDTAPEVPKQYTAEVSNFCANYLDKSRTGFSQPARMLNGALIFIKEKGLTVDKCREAIGLPSLIQSKEVRKYATLSNNSVCYMALSSSGYDFYSKDMPQLFDYVLEAKSRKLSIEDCRKEIGLNISKNITLSDIKQDDVVIIKSNSTTIQKFPEGENRLALVIGNGAYRYVNELPNPKKDADAIADMLSGLGFTVIKGYDLDRTGLENLIRTFAKQSNSADLTLFYYAGHGMQIDGKNYIVPIDAKVEDVTAAEFELIDTDQKILKYMAGPSKTGVVFLDACRDNPFSKKIAKIASRSTSASRGLAPISTDIGGLLIAFATAPGDVASDGDGPHSPFTTALLKHLPTRGLEIEQAMKRIKKDVQDMTNKEQRPWSNSDLQTEVYLVPTNK